MIVGTQSKGSYTRDFVAYDLVALYNYGIESSFILYDIVFGVQPCNFAMHTL